MRDKVQKDRTPFPGAKAGQEHSGGVQGGKEFGRTRPGLRISLYPDHPPLHRFSLRRKGSTDCAYQFPKRLGGGLMKVDPSPSLRQAKAPQGSPVARLTRLPVDFDVEVALRPVLRPHSDRGGSKSWERWRGRVAPGKSSLHAHGEGQCVIALESW